MTVTVSVSVRLATLAKAGFDGAAPVKVQVTAEPPGKVEPTSAAHDPFMAWMLSLTEVMVTGSPVLLVIVTWKVTAAPSAVACSLSEKTVLALASLSFWTEMAGVTSVTVTVALALALAVLPSLSTTVTEAVLV